MPCPCRNAFASGSVNTLRCCARAAAMSVAMSADRCVGVERGCRAPTSMVDTQDHLAELLRRFEIAMGGSRFLHREYPVDHRLQLAAAQLRHHHSKLMLVGAV